MLSEDEYRRYGTPLMSEEEKRKILRRHMNEYDTEYVQFRILADCLGWSEQERITFIRDKTKNISLI